MVPRTACLGTGQLCRSAFRELGSVTLAGRDRLSCVVWGRGFGQGLLALRCRRLTLLASLQGARSGQELDLDCEGTGCTAAGLSLGAVAI